MKQLFDFTYSQNVSLTHDLPVLSAADIRTFWLRRRRNSLRVIHTSRERVQLGEGKANYIILFKCSGLSRDPHSEPGLVLGDRDRDSKLKQRFLQGSVFLSWDLVLQVSPHPAAKPIAEGKGSARLSMNTAPEANGYLLLVRPLDGDFSGLQWGAAAHCSRVSLSGPWLVSLC